MARVYPSGWNDRLVTGGAKREIETLAVLHKGLPDTYAVYHGVHWTRLQHGFSIFGEADFVVVSPAGRVLAIEQKSGPLEETDDGLVKLYLGKPKNVATQIARTIAGMRARLSSAFGAARYKLEEMLYCPDYQVTRPSISGVNPSRIVDAFRRDRLCEIVQEILPSDEASLLSQTDLHAFFADELKLVPDVGATIGEAAKHVTRISGGLATWARAIECEPFRLRVIGTAGSGKTQLAVRVLEDAVRDGKRALYLCYNRPLADYLRDIAPPEVAVLTYHQLCQQASAAAGVATDLTSSKGFDDLARWFADDLSRETRRFDTIIVDEGQDFAQAWVAPIEHMLDDGGKLWWLEDPMQNLYRRPSVELPGWVVVRAKSNYRSPRDVVRLISRLSDSCADIEASGPIDNSDMGVYTYGDNGVVEATAKAISEALKLGFSPADIAVLTYHGRERSVIAKIDQVGPHRLRRFIGEFDERDTPQFRDGDILVESIFRFKGQSAPCVILTEIDFGNFDDDVSRRLFVGATRATLKLMLVLSETAAGLALSRL